MSIINCKICFFPHTCSCLCNTCIATKCAMRDAGKVNVAYYLELRRMGLRAVSAFIVAKYGFDGLMSLLIDEELNGRIEGV